MNRRAAVAALLALSVVPGADGRARADDARIPDEQIVVASNVRYRDSGPAACLVDIAAPKDHSGPRRPAIVVIHGGGWIEGDKSSFSTMTNRVPGNIIDFASRGFVAATINYRLSREAPFPAGLDDCRAAVRWLRAHADDYHLDPARVGAWGNSAGGHLALLLAMMPEEPASAAEPNAAQPSRVQAACSDSGPIDLVYQIEHQQLKSVVETFMGGPLEGARRATYKRASPSSYVNEKLPPLLLLYGEADEQVDVRSADALVAALSAAGHKQISFFRLAGIGHCPHSIARVPYLKGVVEDYFIEALKAPAR